MVKTTVIIEGISNEETKVIADIAKSTDTDFSVSENGVTISQEGYYGIIAGCLLSTMTDIYQIKLYTKFP